MKTHEKYMAIHTELVEEALGKPYELEVMDRTRPWYNLMSKDGVTLEVHREGAEYLWVAQVKTDTREQDDEFEEKLARAIAARPEMVEEEPGDEQRLASEWRSAKHIQETYVLQAAGEGAERQPHRKLGYRFYLITGGDVDVTTFDEGNGWMSIEKVKPNCDTGLGDFEDRLREAVQAGIGEHGPGCVMQ